MSAKEKANEALVKQVKTQTSIGQAVGNDPVTLLKQNVDATAANVLHQELGQFGKTEFYYDLDQATRDVLLVHGRQDSSAAYAMASTNLDLVAQANKYSQYAVIFSFFAFALSAVILYKVW